MARSTGPPTTHNSEDSLVADLRWNSAKNPAVHIEPSFSRVAAMAERKRIARHTALFQHLDVPEEYHLPCSNLGQWKLAGSRLTTSLVLVDVLKTTPSKEDAGFCWAGQVAVDQTWAGVCLHP